MEQRGVILGSGFGGLSVALELERALAYRDDLEVTLVNRETFVLFTPILHKEQGRVIVDDCLRVPGSPGVWALGDIMANAPRVGDHLLERMR